MKLTGKAKEDFIKSQYIKNGMYNFLIMHPIYQNTLIIEWFDSAGIYINIHVITNPKYSYSINNKRFYEWFSSRQEAIYKAIEKANEIYNQEF